jgi:IS30 family transposase
MNSAGPTRRPWTTGEQKKLDDLLSAGKTGREIATALQRTPQSIYSQLHRLDIKRKKAARRVVQIGLKAKICGSG